MYETKTLKTNSTDKVDMPRKSKNKNLVSLICLVVFRDMPPNLILSKCKTTVNSATTLTAVDDGDNGNAKGVVGKKIGLQYEKEEKKCGN